jgi:hypothetical protein
MQVLALPALSLSAKLKGLLLLLLYTAPTALSLSLQLKQEKLLSLTRWRNSRRRMLMALTVMMAIETLLLPTRAALSLAAESCPADASHWD